MINKGDTGGQTVKPQKRPPKAWKQTFLRALRNSANVRAACEAAMISRKTAYEHYAKGGMFKELWDEYIEDACDILEAKAWKRADVSDAVLMFLLRAHRPGKYTERVKNEIDVKGKVELFNHDVITGLFAARPSGDSETSGED